MAMDRRLFIAILLLAAGCGPDARQQYQAACAIRDSEESQLKELMPAFAEELQKANLELYQKDGQLHGGSKESEELARTTPVGVQYSEQEQRALRAVQDALAAEAKFHAERQ